MPFYSSKIGGMQAVGDLGHTLKQGPYTVDVDLDVIDTSWSLKGGAAALGYPASLQNGIHRWTIRVHSGVWMIGFATDVWLKELPGCQAKPGCWLLGSDGSKNDISGSRNFGMGFGKDCEVVLELWLDGTEATMKFAPEFQVLRTMSSGLNFAAAPHNGTKIYPVVFGLRSIGNLATVVAYDGPQPFAMEGINSSLVTCHRAVPSNDGTIELMCTSASGDELALISCKLSGVVADLQAALAARLGKPSHALILVSVEGCLFTGDEHLTELALEPSALPNGSQIRRQEQRGYLPLDRDSKSHLSKDCPSPLGWEDNVEELQWIVQV